MLDLLWNRIRRLEGRELHTLSRHSAFKITHVDKIGAEGYPVKTRKRLLIRRNFLEPMWEDLRREGRLVIADWKTTTTLPSRVWATTYAAAILAELEEVEVEGEGRTVALIVKR